MQSILPSSQLVDGKMTWKVMQWHVKQIHLVDQPVREVIEGRGSCKHLRLVPVCDQRYLGSFGMKLTGNLQVPYPCIGFDFSSHLFAFFTCRAREVWASASQERRNLRRCQARGASWSWSFLLLLLPWRYVYGKDDDGEGEDENWKTSKVVKNWAS